MTNFVNLTPHALNIRNANGDIVDFPVTGTIARVAQTATVVNVINGINITKQVFGNVVDLPDPQPDTIFIVARLVAAAAPDRKDLMIPGPMIRDDQGRVIGADGLAVL